MRVAGRIVLLVLAPGVLLLVALALVPRHRLGLVDLYLLVVAALALTSLLRALRRASPARSGGPRDLAWLGVRPLGRQPRPVAIRPGDLEWLERRLRIAAHSMLALQAVRSVVREVAAHRLQAHHQVDLDADPATTRRLLGADVWDLLVSEPERRDQERERGGRDRPGLEVAQLRRVIEALERT